MVVLPRGDTPDCFVGVTSLIDRFFGGGSRRLAKEKAKGVPKAIDVKMHQRTQ
jgi:hypothetical protein